MEPDTNKIEPLTNPLTHTRRQQINRLSSMTMIVLSLTALLMVLGGYAFPAQAHQPDEADAAHIFQLSIAALVPTIILFISTADWKRPRRSARPLAFASAVLATAFVALFYLEH